MNLSLSDSPPEEDIAQKLIVALDVPGKAPAMALVEQLRPLGVTTFKVGMSLFYQEGLPLVKDLVARGCEVFLDLKLHDIPSTVARTVDALVREGVSFLNVHAQGGPEMMRAAMEAGRAAAQATGQPEPLIIGVTVLTSFSAESLRENLRVPMEVAAYGIYLAQMAQASGLNGVVCSPQEAGKIREACGEKFVLVTPGIRMPEDDLQDQSRVATPAGALHSGADYLVVGRPILNAPDPVKATEAILKDMTSGYLQETAW